jgi:hypothetical protein
MWMAHLIRSSVHASVGMRFQLIPQLTLKNARRGANVSSFGIYGIWNNVMVALAGALKSIVKKQT